MTREQLDAIRARYADEPLLVEMRTDTLGNLITVPREHPIVTLLAEVERLTAELDKVGEVLAATSIKCDYAFSRGVAAMREAAAGAIDCPAADCPCNGKAFATHLRALPDPEDTE